MSAIGLRVPGAVQWTNRASRAARERLSDEELVEQVVAGDQTAFACLYDRHAAVAYGLALRIVRSRSLAEDVVQDAFVSAWRTAGRFRAAQASGRSWILMLVHRRAVDAIRREVRLGRAQLAEPARDAPSSEDSATLNLERARVQSALAALPAVQRQALELAYYGGLTQSQVAEAIEEPLGTVKSRMSGGLKRLRGILVEEAPGVEQWTRSPSTT